jgi:hypothetical protein
MGNFTTEGDDTMEAMSEEDIYKYLGHMQSKQIKHAQMKHKLGEEYLNRTKSILKTKLNVKNTIQAINTYATPVLTFSFGRVKWMPADLENRQVKTRTLLTRYRFHHLRAAKERLILPRQMGGRCLIDITRLQVKLLQTCFSSKQDTSPLYAAVVKADDSDTPLDLFRVNENEFATDEEYTNEVKRQWSQNALHGRHPYDLSQQYVDIEASNKWLTSADLFAETEGFLTAIQGQVILTNRTNTKNWRMKYVLCGSKKQYK